MKHHTEIVINASRAHVWSVFDDTDNLSKWQPTLESFEHVSGEPGQPGAVSQLTYNENGRKVVLTESINERREPAFLAGIYESSFGTNTIVTQFEVIDDNTTNMAMWCNFRFRGIMKLLALFSGRSIRCRLDEDLQRFKALAEADGKSQ